MELLKKYKIFECVIELSCQLLRLYIGRSGCQEWISIYTI